MRLSTGKELSAIE